jgi:hypothetical protein
VNYFSDSTVWTGYLGKIEVLNGTVQDGKLRSFWFRTSRDAKRFQNPGALSASELGKYFKVSLSPPTVVALE